MMVEIPIYYKGQLTEYRALIDDEDFELVNKVSWHLFKKKSGDVYVYSGHREARTRTSRGRKTVFMQNYIMQPRDDEVIDHLNGNGLDNRKKNFRRCTRSANLKNTRRFRLFFDNDIERVKIALSEMDDPIT